jgi:hypothetical protein
VKEAAMVRVDVALAHRAGRNWKALAIAASLLIAGSVSAQQPAAQAQPAKSPYVFASDGALVLNFVKADKTADFEMVLGKLREALMKSEKPERKQQAASWKVFKAAEPGPNMSAIYVSFMYPAVKGADYSVGTVLSEGFPQEVQAIFKTYSESFGNPAQNILNLTLVQDLSK